MTGWLVLDLDEFGGSPCRTERVGDAIREFRTGASHCSLGAIASHLFYWLQRQTKYS